MYHSHTYIRSRTRRKEQHNVDGSLHAWGLHEEWPCHPDSEAMHAGQALTGDSGETEWGIYQKTKFKMERGLLKHNNGPGGERACAVSDGGWLDCSTANSNCKLKEGHRLQQYNYWIDFQPPSSITPCNDSFNLPPSLHPRGFNLLSLESWCFIYHRHRQ